MQIFSINKKPRTRTNQTRKRVRGGISRVSMAELEGFSQIWSHNAQGSFVSLAQQSAFCLLAALERLLVQRFGSGSAFIKAFKVRQVLPRHSLANVPTPQSARAVKKASLPSACNFSQQWRRSPLMAGMFWILIAQHDYFWGEANYQPRKSDIDRFNDWKLRKASLIIAARTIRLAFSWACAKEGACCPYGGLGGRWNTLTCGESPLNRPSYRL